MHLRAYLEQHKTGMQERKRLAAVCRVSLAYIYQLSGGFKSPKLWMAQDIHVATKGKIGLHDWPVPLIVPIPGKIRAGRPKRFSPAGSAAQSP